MTDLSVSIRRAVGERDQGTCQRCGARGTNIQHRIGRGMGGTKRAVVNDLSALVILCGSGTTGCHGWITDHPELAYATGWAVRRSSRELPSEIPLIRLDGSSFCLTEEGDVVPVMPAGFYPAPNQFTPPF